MRNLIRSAVLALGLLPGFAHAQSSSFPQTLPPNTVAGRLGINAGPTQAIPFLVFLNNLPLPSGKILIGSTGNLATPQTISGDATLSTSGALTLATVNANTGAFGSATQCVTVTNNAKGLTTAVSAATCTPAVGSITGLGLNVNTALAINVGSAGSFYVLGGALGTPSSATLTNATGLPISTGLTGAGTGILAALAINTGSAGAPVLFNGNGGTPSAMVGTNITGTAGGLSVGAASTALTVTTNANLTGPVTSVGNATTIGANQVTRANEAQGVARSVVGVTGNATANVADIQGAANQFLGVNSGGTALAFTTMSQDCTLATGVITCTKTNNVAFAASATTDTTNAANISSGTLPPARLPSASVTNTLVADVTMNTSVYFDGPSTAQGTTGTWSASGSVVVLDTVGQATFACKLWDGTTVISSGASTTQGANLQSTISLSGTLATPAANIKISCLDLNGSPAGKIKFNASGAGKDATLTAYRIN